MSDLAPAIQAVIDSGPYANEADLLASIEHVLACNGWVLKHREWGINGFPELGSGDAVFTRVGSNDLVVETKLVSDKLTAASRESHIVQQAAYYGRMWARLNPGIRVTAVAWSDKGAVMTRILTERKFVLEAAHRLSESHNSVRW